MLKLGRNSCRLICQTKAGQSIIHSIDKSCNKKGKLNIDIPFNEEEDEKKSGGADGDDEATWNFVTQIYESR